ncbi:LysR family transcriptional regulator [Thaumasiovibrio sp. DFM-14]|uniref:LysR family transcriptional regulator n=1 Tax=Thaumasiovibrio sp. DFM-14 TaxID=3384792 RepID=UPI0039A11BAD
MFTLEQVICFDMVCDTCSYSEAGRKLNRKRNTVREHIKALEDELGFTLFDICGKKLLPTAKATLLRQRASHIAKHARDFEAVARALFDNTLDRLVLVHDVFIPSGFLADIQNEINRCFPAMRLVFQQASRQDAYNGLIQGHYHVALLSSENRTKTTSELAFINIGSIKLEPYISSVHPLAQKKSVSIDELRIIPQWMTEDAVNSEGIGRLAFSNQCHTVSSLPLLQALLSKDGWSTLPRHIAAPLLATKMIKRLQIDEMLQPIGERVCAFMPIGYASIPEMVKVVELIRLYAPNYFH